MLIRSNARSDNSVIPFVDKPEHGLIWAGLRSSKGTALCDKLYEVVDSHSNTQGCTHGPDPAPEGLDPQRSVEPLSTGDGGSISTANSIGCDGDGVTGKRVEVIYVYASDRADRYDTYLASFRQYASDMNDIYLGSAQQTGGSRNLRFVTDASCAPVINKVILSTTGDDSFGNTVSELKNKGFNRNDRKYLVFADATVYCGIGSLYNDDSAAQNNSNNGGPSYSRVDSGCWGGNLAAHEIMHNLGGVQLSAPHSTGGYHCTDEYDRMCYADAQGVTMNFVCSSSQESRLDCNKDDYYNTNPPAGSYLANHWNAANASYYRETNGSTPPPPTDDATAPTVSITSPLNDSTITNRASIAANATDNVGVVKIELYIDGGLRASSKSNTISYNWNSRKASRGAHTITVKAYDQAGNSGLSTITVYK